MLISSSFSIVGIPYYFVVPYLITFSVFLFFSIRYSDKTLKFWKNKEGEIFVGLGWNAFTYYAVAAVGRIAVLIIVTSFLPNISDMLNIKLAGIVSPIYATLSVIAITAIFFDFMLLAGKGFMLGLDIGMLKHYRLIASGKEKAGLD